ncbi:MAG: MFS transporter [Dehalococcoidia bacterium]|nr:MFS transporter [Dehalococcoidia bacterium]
MRNPLQAWGILRDSNYRWLWVANGLFFASQQAELLALQWIVLDLTESKTLLGLLSLLQGLAILFMSPLGGVAAERMPRRNLLVYSRVGLVLKTAILSALIFSGHIQVWHIIISVMVAGTLLAIAQPATQSFLYDIVGPQKLPAAIAFNATAMSTASLIGPSLGGVFIYLAGAGMAYLCGGAGYLIGILFMLMIPIAGKTGGLPRTNVFRDVVEGARYARSSPLTMWVLFLVSLNFFGSGIILMRPVYARDILHVGAPGLGLMGLAWGLGALISSLLVPLVFDRFKRLGWIIIIGVLQFDIATVVFAFSRDFTLSLVLLVIIGSVTPFYGASGQAMLQLSAPDDMRGRVLGFFFMMQQFVLVGQFFVGALADAISPTWALAISASIRVILAVVVLVIAAPLRDFGKPKATDKPTAVIAG